MKPWDSLISYLLKVYNVFTGLTKPLFKKKCSLEEKKANKKQYKGRINNIIINTVIINEFNNKVTIE